MSAGSQEIKCNVTSCRYNDQSRYCSLDDIVVGTTNSANPKDKCDTECVSFENM